MKQKIMLQLFIAKNLFKINNVATATTFLPPISVCVMR